MFPQRQDHESECFTRASRDDDVLGLTQHSPGVPQVVGDFRAQSQGALQGWFGLWNGSRGGQAPRGRPRPPRQSSGRRVSWYQIQHIKRMLLTRVHHRSRWRREGSPVQQNGHARRRSLGADQVSVAVELLVLSERLMPGRSEEVRPMTRRELAATVVLCRPLTEMSMKMRSGAPSEAVDDGENHAVWAGVVPVVTGWGAPAASPLTADGTEVPASVRRH